MKNWLRRWRTKRGVVAALIFAAPLLIWWSVVATKRKSEARELARLLECPNFAAAERIGESQNAGRANAEYIGDLGPRMRRVRWTALHPNGRLGLVHGELLEGGFVLDC